MFRRGDAASHPYRQEGDKAYGLGIADCKGGLIIAVYSVLVMQEAELLPDIEDVKRKFEIEPHYPMERSQGNVALYHKVRSVRRLLGYELPEQKSSGSGDGSFFTCHNIPTVDGLGAYMYQIHSFDESMRISSLEEKTCLFASVLGLLDHMKEEE